MALLLSTDVFEGFYGNVLGLNVHSYLESYRNDFSWYYVDGLRENDIDTVLYIPSNKTSGRYDTKDGYHIRFFKVRDWYSRIWGDHPWLSRTPLGRYVSQVANTISFFFDLVTGLRADGVDVLYVQEYWTGRFDYLAWRSPIPVVGADHGGRPYHQIKWFKKLSYQKAGYLTCQTQEEMVNVCRYGSKCMVLPNGVDTDYFVPSEVQKDIRSSKNILTVARLTDTQKRTSDLLRALSHLDESWHLTVVGDGPDREILEGMATEIGVFQRVEFKGFVADRNELLEFYQSCDVFALPSAWEGLPLAVLEAMACALPVVTSDIQAFRGLIKHEENGILCKVGDYRQLARAIERAYELSTKLAYNGRYTVEEYFSQKTMFKKLSQLIASLSLDSQR